MPTPQTCDLLCRFLILRDEKVSEKQINLGANAQIVGAFTDFFPERQFTGIFTGTLELTFDQDIYFTAIQLKTFQTGEAIEERLMAASSEWLDRTDGTHRVFFQL